MATKKQKREEALARRDAFLAEQRRTGLQALEVDRARRQADKDRIERERSLAASKQATLRLRHEQKQQKNPTPLTAAMASAPHDTDDYWNAIVLRRNA